MRSSTGEHYLALDHLRALAAFMVFMWHFLHAVSGTPVAFAQAPLVFPLALLDEGHVGVALFMTLSGYLFAKLLHGRPVIYSRFIWNRALRLLPLLLFVIALRFAWMWAEEGSSAAWGFLQSIPGGLVFPTLPNGGWSITVEFHFYLLLPLLLLMVERSRWSVLAIIAAALLLRAGLYWKYGTVQDLAYFTIVGRVDQFMLGIAAARLDVPRERLRAVFPFATLAFLAFYWWFDRSGGFMRSPGYPSSNPIWMAMATVEGLYFALLIRWYDARPSAPAGRFSRWLGRAGEYSYSIYLLHMFLVFGAAQFIHARVMNIANFYLAVFWGLLCFVLMVPLAGLSYRTLELPFMRWRKVYVRTEVGQR